MRKQIWLNPPLERLLSRLDDASDPKNRRSGQFSRRLGDIVERYDILIKQTPLPELTDEEMFIMSEVICGSVINDLKIKYLADGILDCATGTPESRKALFAKVAEWTPAERLALIESMGQ